MSNYAPYARIFIRYVVGIVVGADMADSLAGDADVVSVFAIAIGAIVEAVYMIAKKRGWST